MREDFALPHESLPDDDGWEQQESERVIHLSCMTDPSNTQTQRSSSGAQTMMIFMIMVGMWTTTEFREGMTAHTFLFHIRVACPGEEAGLHIPCLMVTSEKYASPQQKR